MALPAVSIPAGAIIETLRSLKITRIVSVPDTHQRSLLRALDQITDIRVLTCSTEDEAVAAGAGLWIGGIDCALMIQHAGLFACVNNLRGIGLDMKIPLFMIVGLLGRDVARLPAENSGSMVRLAQPILDTLGIAHSLIDGPADLPLLVQRFHESREREAPTVAFIGAPTA